MISSWTIDVISKATKQLVKVALPEQANLLQKSIKWFEVQFQNQLVIKIHIAW